MLTIVSGIFCMALSAHTRSNIGSTHDPGILKHEMLFIRVSLAVGIAMILYGAFDLLLSVPSAEPSFMARIAANLAEGLR